MKNNIWSNLEINKQKRIEAISPYSLYWFVNEKGNYGMAINFNNINISNMSSLNLKEIILNLGIYRGSTILSLTLLNKENYEMFFYICEDLIEICQTTNDGLKVFKLIEARLKQWQNLLSKTPVSDFSIQIQMGLFSELYFLLENCSSGKSMKKILEAWVGPDFDKQDFQFETSSVEIKSFKSGKEPHIIISSQYQLSSLKEKNYLCTYALSFGDNGLSIQDLIEKIQPFFDDKLLYIFKRKVLAYGYDENVHKNLLKKLIVDKKYIHTITNDFPRIDQSILAPEIMKVNYVLNLSLCSRFVVDNIEF